jgi:hypothetical protein
VAEDVPECSQNAVIFLGGNENQVPTYPLKAFFSFFRHYFDEFLSGPGYFSRYIHHFRGQREPGSIETF